MYILNISKGYVPDIIGKIRHYIAYMMRLSKTNNSECLSNKYINNHYIYVSGFFIDSSSYMHCNKIYRDTCKTNDDCSSLDYSKEDI
ncbi:hypothetical protein U3516DRAFT_750991 [Neocallimastix sp. 'constans']